MYRETLQLRSNLLLHSEFPCKNGMQFSTNCSSSLYMAPGFQKRLCSATQVNTSCVHECLKIKTCQCVLLYCQIFIFCTKITFSTRKCLWFPLPCRPHTQHLTMPLLLTVKLTPTACECESVNQLKRTKHNNKQRSEVAVQKVHVSKTHRHCQSP